MIETAAIGRVVFLLDATSHPQQAAALAFASNAVCLATSRALAVGASKAGARGEHPMATMQRLLHSKWKRRLLAWVVLRMDVHFAGPDGLPAPFLQHYRSRFESRLQPARELGGLGDFTFVVVQRARALAAAGESGAGGEKKRGAGANKGGAGASASEGEEFARFRFICFREVEEALRFFSHWQAAQRSARSQQQAMSLMEAGPSNAETPRKWIIDLDAKVADLRAAGILCWPERGCTDADEAHLHHAVVQYACALSRGLHTLGFTPRACNFALKCRHRRGEGGYQKLSWHVTLCAMAPYAQLRAAMSIVHERLCPGELLAARDAKAEVPTGLMRSDWLMAYFSDTHIGANSKGQFMQALGSRKVVANVPVDPGESAFEFCGVFSAASGMAVRAPSEIVRFAATSMSLCDPWCVPLQCGEQETGGRSAGQKRPAAAAACEGGGKRQQEQPPQRGLARWDLLPPSDAPWMLPLLCDAATTTLKEIPSMANPEHMAYAVSNLLKSGRGDIVFYANVVRPRLCPRHIANADDAHAIHRHGSNNMIAVCVREHNENSEQRKEGLEPPFSVHRLFTRCFSQKCMQHTVKGNPWVELKPHHCHRMRALAGAGGGGAGSKAGGGNAGGGKG